DSSVPVHFDTMTRGSVEVRRLSTISSILDPSFTLATKWIWYFEDEHRDWIQYGSSVSGTLDYFDSTDILLRL
ncbi:poly [ADP-ribose] polymerase 12-like, partial [Clarias magur]